MPVRAATKADIPTMAAILAASFGPDPLFQMMFPHQSPYPKAFVQAFEEHMWLSWYNHKRDLLVSYCETSTDDNQEGSLGEIEDGRGETEPLLLPKARPIVRKHEVLTGIAELERAGSGWEHVYGIWQKYGPRFWAKSILGAFYAFRRHVFGNKAAVQATPDNPSPLTYWNFLPAVLPFGAPFFSAPHRETHLSLEILGIHPEHQRQGYGARLVEEVLRRAKSAPIGDIPACVIAAEGKEGFYEKCGFKHLVGWMSRTTDASGRDNPLRANGVGGGAVLWTR